MSATIAILEMGFVAINGRSDQFRDVVPDPLIITDRGNHTPHSENYMVFCLPFLQSNCGGRGARFVSHTHTSLDADGLWACGVGVEMKWKINRDSECEMCATML